MFQNGVLVQGSIYGSAAGTQINTGTVMLVASAGDILSVRNHTSPAAVTLQPLAGGIQSNVNASIKIQKLGN